MHAIVLCTKCGRKRITDLNCATSSCPYCGMTEKIERMRILFSHADRNTVRNVFAGADSERYEGLKRKRPANDPDPLSTLMYEYEHTSGLPEKLMVLAAGLTRIRKEFGEADLEYLFPGEGERMMEQMIAADLVIETGYGKFRAV